MKTNEIVGYRVKSGQQYVHTNFTHTWVSYIAPSPISLPDAYKRAAAFVSDHPEDVEYHGVPVMEPVYRELSPLEKAAAELGVQLTSLCKKHGLQLGLTQEQIDKQLAKELLEFAAKK